MDLEIVRALHKKSPEPEWCDCGHRWPCPILGVYEGRALPVAAKVVSLKVCRHYRTREITVYGDQAYRYMCLHCQAEWSELPRFLERVA